MVRLKVGRVLHHKSGSTPTRFNSIMVRLKDGVRKLRTRRQVTKFQFHIGAIKSVNLTYVNGFTFGYGFNSTMVRLKDTALNL